MKKNILYSVSVGIVIFSSSLYAYSCGELLENSYFSNLNNKEKLKNPQSKEIISPKLEIKKSISKTKPEVDDKVKKPIKISNTKEIIVKSKPKIIKKDSMVLSMCPKKEVIFSYMEDNKKVKIKGCILQNTNLLNYEVVK